MTTPRHLELFIRDNKTVAQCRTETNGRLDDPVPIAVAGPEWSAFLSAWGKTQAAEIIALTDERNALQTSLHEMTTDRDAQKAVADTIPGLNEQISGLTTDKADLTSQVATLTSERDTLQTQVDTISGLESQIESLTTSKAELEAEVTRLAALVPPPLPSREIPPRDFLARISDDDKLSIMQSKDPRCMVAMMNLFTALSVNLDSPVLIGMIDALVDAGIPIDEADRTRIFA